MSRSVVVLPSTVGESDMNRHTLLFWISIIVACGVFTAIPWNAVHPAAAVGYEQDGSLASD
jgi:hypothetical protein